MEVKKTSINCKISDSLQDKEISDSFARTMDSLPTLQSPITNTSLVDLSAYCLNFRGDPADCSRNAPKSAQIFNLSSGANLMYAGQPLTWPQEMPIYGQVPSGDGLSLNKPKILGDLNVNDLKSWNYSVHHLHYGNLRNQSQFVFSPNPEEGVQMAYPQHMLVTGSSGKAEDQSMISGSNLYNLQAKPNCYKTQLALSHQAGSAFKAIRSGQEAEPNWVNIEGSPQSLVSGQTGLHNLVFPKTADKDGSYDRKTKIITKWEHTSRKHYAKGMCSTCYHKSGRTKKAWNCEHKEELHYAKGCCQECYLIFHSKRGKNKLKKLMNERRKKLREQNNQKAKEIQAAKS